MIIEEQEGLVDEWSNEEPFFSFELPMYHVIMFKGVDIPTIIRGMLSDLIIPYKTIRNKRHPMFQQVQEQVDIQAGEHREIECLILPIRYTKVFEA